MDERTGLVSKQGALPRLDLAFTNSYLQILRVGHQCRSRAGVVCSPANRLTLSSRKRSQAKVREPALPCITVERDPVGEKNTQLARRINLLELIAFGIGTTGTTPCSSGPSHIELVGSGIYALVSSGAQTAVRSYLTFTSSSANPSGPRRLYLVPHRCTVMYLHRTGIHRYSAVSMQHMLTSSSEFSSRIPVAGSAVRRLSRDQLRTYADLHVVHIYLHLCW